MRTRSIDLGPKELPPEPGEIIQVRETGWNGEFSVYEIEIIRYLDGGFWQWDLYGDCLRTAIGRIESGRDEGEMCRIWFKMEVYSGG